MRVVRSGGNLPRHVAFIMDGNRRYARKQNVELAQGHLDGYRKLEEALTWCAKLDIKVVTVYAFSIENFRRKQLEVDTLMRLCAEKLIDMCNPDHPVMRNGIRVRVVGNLTHPLIPENVRRGIENVTRITENNNRATLNICFAYTSRFEMADAVRSAAHACTSCALAPASITPAELERRMCTTSSVPVDMIVRTSGEKRLSDFLLWQSAEAAVFFVSENWPEFSLFSFLRLILRFQAVQHSIPTMKCAPTQNCASLGQKSALMSARGNATRHDSAPPLLLLILCLAAGSLLALVMAEPLYQVGPRALMRQPYILLIAGSSCGVVWLALALSALFLPKRRCFSSKMS